MIHLRMRLENCISGAVGEGEAYLMPWEELPLNQHWVPARGEIWGIAVR